MQDKFEKIIAHYVANWGSEPKIYLWGKGPIQKLYYQFRVLEFPPATNTDMWKYATVFMSGDENGYPIELFVFSSKQDHSLVELLFAVGYYHQNTHKLSLNDSVNFGRGWQGASVCNYGFISLPYIGGPDLETLKIEGEEIKFYWLIPVTEQEVEYRKSHGTDALEDMFEEKGLDYINPGRASLI